MAVINSSFFFSAQDIKALLKEFQTPPYTCIFKGDTAERREIFQNCHKKNQNILYEKWGFQLEIKQSTVFEGGRGVFVKKGKICKDQVACLYPGLIYKPYHPILIASIRNAYIFRCSDGTMLDGKTKGVSG